MTPSPEIARSTVPEGSTAHWRDRKRYLWLIGLVVPSLAFIAIGMWTLTGWGVWFWIGPVVILGIVPAIDLVAGLDRSNPPDDVIEALEKDRYYRWITYLFLPIQYAGFVGAMFSVMTHDDLSVVDRVGIAVSIGCIGGIGINTAHELGHKKEANERWLSKIALAQSFYGHFYIEHNRGHHVRVATPEDPASARLGESFYEFWPRTVGGSLRSAWNLEKRRIARRKQHPWRLSNDVLNAWLMSAVLWGVHDRGLRRRDRAVPGDPGGRRLLPARGRQLHGALRDAAAEGRRRRARALRAGRPFALVELQQHRDQRAALPPAAPQRPPREPDPALPVVARLRGEPGAADRVRRDDRARDRPGSLAAGDGSEGARPLRRATSRARTSPRGSASGSWSGTPWVPRRSRKPAGLAAARRPRMLVDGCRRTRPPRLRTSHRLPSPPERRSRPRTRRWCGGALAASTSTTWSRGRRGKGSRPGRRGRRSPTRGAAPTAGCATRSTSSRGTPSRGVTIRRFLD